MRLEQCTPYHGLVQLLTDEFIAAREYPCGGFPALPIPELPSDAPCVLLFSPHPDDECITGALPLRLLHQAKCRVINVAVTQGSRRDRQAARFAELQGACDYLGFELVSTRPGGLEQISPSGRVADAGNWLDAVARVVEILREYRPLAVFCPHPGDWNGTHIGTHQLVMAALGEIGDEMIPWVVETEFWGAMEQPNVLVESTPEEVATLMAATSFHVGEVSRNPYHLLLPAWMQDNVRRGAELVGGQGGAAPDFIFGTLYRINRWEQRRLNPVEQKVILSTADKVDFDILWDACG